MITRERFLAAAAAAGVAGLAPRIAFAADAVADTILYNGTFATLDPRRPRASAVAIVGEHFHTVGSTEDVMRLRGSKTRMIDVGKRTVVPGLNDSHIHFVRGSLGYNQEVRWDGVPSLKDALALLKRQVERTPAPQWVRVGGGLSEFQFAERRMPTIAELNAVAPDTPVYVLHFYERALINQAAINVLGYTKDTPDPPGGVIERDSQGNPTGVLLSHPFPNGLLAPLGKAPFLSPEDTRNSVLQFMHELNRFGMTSVVDPGGLGQNYPADYATLDALAKDKLLTLRVAMYLLPQRPGQELEDLTTWVDTVRRSNDDWYKVIGGGEWLVWSAQDWDPYTQPRVVIPPTMEASMSAAVRELVSHQWPFRLHATFDETISRDLDAFEAVNREVPLNSVRWTLDHAELISPRNLERVQKLGGSVNVQHRMGYHGEYALKYYAPEVIAEAPPLRRLLDMGIPIGAGSYSTSETTYNPWVFVLWLITGKTMGGLTIAAPHNRLDRETALRLYTRGSAWFSGDENKKGAMIPGMYADLAVLSQDFFSVPADQISATESELTMVGGAPVYASATSPFAALSPPPLPVSPGWSPVAGDHNGFFEPHDQVAQTHVHAHHAEVAHEQLFGAC